ncbi:MAG: molecular chaperone DnaK [Pseudomonadota bacterium]
MSRVIGIDLGTTNCCVAVTEGRQTTVIPNKGGYRTTPSVVALLEDGKTLVGQIAKRQAITNPANTIMSAKRLIGRRIDAPEVARARSLYHYEISEGPKGDLRLHCQNKAISLPEISSYVLAEMKRVAEHHLKEKVNDAVITVPAYFNDGQRQATKVAGKIAGLNVLRIINEPTAAAIAYGFNRKNNKKVAVYDLGGGTFDISLLEINEGVFKVLGTSGDTFLGGDDFDNLLIDHVANRFLESDRIDIRNDRQVLQRLRDGCEKAKCDLSNFLEAEINLPFIATTEKGPVHLAMKIDRETLERLTSGLVERTLEITKQCMKEAGIDKDDLDDVLLVGGQTRMPKVTDTVSNFFGRSASRQINPDEAVAVGAAIQGRALVPGADVEMLLLDVTPLPLGIQSAGGSFTKLIDANTTVPVSAKKVFTTVSDNQPTVRIRVYQGKAPVCVDNEMLGEFVLEGIRRAPAGEAEIEVSFHIDANGIVNVTARDTDTRKQQSITVTMTSGLDDDEIEEMRKHAEGQELLVKEGEQTEASVQKAEVLLYRLKKAFEASGAGLEEGRKKQIQKLMDGAAGFIEKRDTRHLERLIASLEKALAGFE